MEYRQKHCKFCGAMIDWDCVVCPHCGKQVETLQQAPQYNPQVVVNTNQNVNQNVSNPPYSTPHYPKRCEKVTALLLCIFLGWCGAHKFYEGKKGLGILYIFTFGLWGIGWLVDIIIIGTKPEVYYV